MEKIQPTRKQIIEDVRIWSKHFLEVPNLHLGGVPACPFAKKAWLDKKVWVAVKTKNSTYKKELNDCLKNLDFTKKEILIFCDPYFSYSPDELHVATEDFNEWYNRKDFYFMSSRNYRKLLINCTNKVIMKCGLTNTIKRLWYLVLINTKRSMEVYHDG